MAITIPSGAITETPGEVMRRLKRGKTWLYGRLKSDPTFPKPFYLGPKEPRFFQHEIDTWLAGHAAKRAEVDHAHACGQIGDAL